MKSKKPKVCNKKFKRIIEEQYYPISFIERVNLMYHLNSHKRDGLNKNNTKATSSSS
tara:strand:+ start:565 stop:735 length:171 start_codon:yes stop_codon:yes gene_type:complete